MSKSRKEIHRMQFWHEHAFRGRPFRCRSMLMTSSWVPPVLMLKFCASAWQQIELLSHTSCRKAEVLGQHRGALLC